MGNEVIEYYQNRLKEKGYQADDAQIKALKYLQQYCDDWVLYQSQNKNILKRAIYRPQIPKGIYMYGGVGRGKSFLMDCFYEVVPVERKTRLHFHEFMREVHRQLRELQGMSDPLDALGKNIAKRYQLLCFDEFHVSDITDAMILQRLLLALFNNGIGFITTSNFEPNGLYPDGLHRDRILPTIALLNEKLEIINVDAGIDYRLKALSNTKLYYSPLGDDSEKAMMKIYQQLAQSHEDNLLLEIENRAITAKKRSNGVVWFDFSTLCNTPRSRSDYLEISTQFHTVFLSNIPQMLVHNANEARRFTWLVDVFYDRCVKLIISAQVLPELLYTTGPLANEFTRTVSRLIEMQSQEYLAKAHRLIDIKLN